MIRDFHTLKYGPADIESPFSLRLPAIKKRHTLKMLFPATIRQTLCEVCELVLDSELL